MDVLFKVLMGHIWSPLIKFKGHNALDIDRIRTRTGTID